MHVESHEVYLEICKKKTPHTFLKRIKCNVKFPFLVHSTEEVIF